MAKACARSLNCGFSDISLTQTIKESSLITPMQGGFVVIIIKILPRIFYQCNNVINVHKIRYEIIKGLDFVKQRHDMIISSKYDSIESNFK